MTKEIAKVNPQNSNATGRNGTFQIKGIQIESFPLENTDLVFIQGITASKGVLQNGGFTTDREGLQSLKKAIDKTLKEVKNPTKGSKGTPTKK